MDTDKELELLRTALSIDNTLFTIQRNASDPDNDSIRIDCFAAKGGDSPRLMRITDLIAKVLKHRKTPRGLAISNGVDAGRDLAAALSKKLELELKHERVI